MTRGTRTASEAGRSGRASKAWRSPSSSGDRTVKAAGVWRRWRGLSREVSTGVLLWDGGGREAAARRGEISRGRSTGRDRGRGREGPNAEPR